MCVHTIDRGLDSLERKVVDFLGAELDQFDNCDYVEHAPSKSTGDLTIIQLNIRGIGSKISDLKFLIDHSMEDSVPEIVLLSETWLTPFLGGLSLHLNHLIGSRVTNYDWQFGTLPFGLFGSNLDTMGLETYPRTYYGQF